jgi:hypothetical protein
MWTTRLFPFFHDETASLHKDNDGESLATAGPAPAKIGRRATAAEAKPSLRVQQGLGRGRNDGSNEVLSDDVALRAVVVLSRRKAGGKNVKAVQQLLFLEKVKHAWTAKKMKISIIIFKTTILFFSSNK